MADYGSAKYADVTLREPPRTDAEWDTFLQRYAHDRIECHDRPKPHHEDSNDSLLLVDSTVAGSSSSHTRMSTYSLNERTRAEERQRMRDAYEAHGFLPGPEPIDSSLRKRRRMAVRLGLASPELESSKKAAIDEFTKLAQLMFCVDSADIALVTNEPARRRTGIEVTPGDITFKLGICPHYSLGSGALPPNSTDGVRGPIVLPDLSKDWRFAKNPAVTDPSTPTLFYASVPLVVYRKKSPPIDIGTFCLLHPTPKHDFTAKDGEMLVRLAGMLVRQLVTLQGEMDSKHVGSLQTAAIDFIRRSVQPDVIRGQENLRRISQEGPSPVPSPTPSVRHKGSFDTLRLRSVKTQRADSLERHSPNPLIRSNTARATLHGDRPKFRTAPMSSRHLDRFQLDSETDLYMDACTTIRSMLGADVVTIVDLSEFHIYIRRSSCSKDGRSSSRESTHKPSSLQATKEQLSDDFFRHGTVWPAESEPLVQRVARHSTMQTSGSHDRGPRVLATTAESKEDNHDFTTEEASELLSDIIKSYLTTRRAWWLRENADDPIARRVSAFAPPHVKTTLILPSLDIDGRAHFAVFASWHQAYTPNSETGGDLPFVRTLCGAVQASLAVKRMRALEQSQISYSNLQAHELRTPTHQLLAITALLRSAMQDLATAPISEETTVLTTTQQVRDLLPYLDAIDTSGRTLHEIIDNILSFLELRSRDNPLTKQTVPSVPAAQHVAAPRSLEVLFEDLIQKVSEDYRQSRKLLGRTGGRVETVFEIVPPLLGESLEEDHGGALESALLKVLSNAYKFIDGDGFVQIIVDDIPSLLPPAGYDDMAANKRVSIMIEDSGIGMDPSFLENRLFEPFAKEDPFTPGSGLSIHLAHRIIDVMGGQIAVSSSPGRGSTVYIEVPLPRREITVNEDEDEKDSVAVLLTGKTEDMAAGRLVYLAGFEDTEGADYGRRRLGISLARQFRKVGSRITEDLSVAELVVADGSYEEIEVELVELLKSAKSKDVVFLVDDPHDACAKAEQTATEHRTQVRRFRKPVTPAVIREILHPEHANAISSSPSNMNTPQSASDETSAINFPDSVGPHDGSNSPSTVDGAAHAATPRSRNSASTIEDAIASLSLGDYFSSRRRSIKRSAPSFRNNRLASPVSPLSSGSAQTPPLPRNTPSAPQSLNSPQLPKQAEAPIMPADKPCIMVVEDNNINRAILCQMLRGLKADIIEAVDGVEAVEAFRKLDKPVVVLLDINMPRMDGFSACTEFRAIEAVEGRKKSWIVAVTALGSEAERQRGVVVGIDVWMQKPCGKPAISKAVADGTARLQKLDGN